MVSGNADMRSQLLTALRIEVELGEYVDSIASDGSKRANASA
jgi:hypothetical protein